MEISAKVVMQLREMTGTGMMDCKKALVEADGDIDRAVEILREKGLSAAAKKAGRIAAEGLVDSYVSEDGKLGVLLEVNCETDFVAKTDQFRDFVKKIAKQIADANPADVDALMASDMDGQTVEAALNEAVAKIGEKISIRRFVRTEGFVDSYIHMGGKIGVLVQVDQEADKEAVHDVAMQIAAAKPACINIADVDSAELEKEKEILRAQALNEGKPENIVDKMVVGRINKYYKEVCLMEQPFVKDGDVSVKKMINGRFDVLAFTRYEMGEGLQKREDDFAAEVAQQAGM